MKKIKSILTLALIFGFLATATFTSCGGKKDGNTEKTEGEHPAEGDEHPAAGDSSEHPAGDTTEHPANPDNEIEIKH